MRFKAPLKTKLILLFFAVFCLLPAINAKASRYYTYRDIKRIFLRAVKDRLTWVNGKIALEKFKIEPENLRIPKRFRYKVKFFSPPTVGSVCALITFYDENYRKEAILRVWGYVEAEVPVVVALRPIRCRSIIRKEDIALELKPLSRLPQDVIFKKVYVIGKQARVSIAPGTVLRMSYVELPVIIKRNQQVSIIAKGKCIVVRASGKALENGRLGEIIRVMNLESKRVVWAKVISPQEVEVMF